MDTFGILFAVVLAILILAGLREPFRRMFFMPKWDFFVSHKSDDNHIIRPIVEQLKQRKFRVWVDFDRITPEQTVQQRFRYPISVGVQQSAFVLIFTSNRFERSEYCREEALFFVKRFAAHPNRIIEIRLDSSNVRNVLEFPREVFHIDLERFTGSNDHTMYEQLVDTIVAHVRTTR